MKILILGGTGVMGKFLIDLLDRDENYIVITSRKRRLSGGRVRYVEGNAKDQRFLGKILESSWDVIVDFMVYTTDEFSDSYQILTRSTQQYIFISSARVFENSSNVITENSPFLLNVTEDKEYLRTDEYALAKARQENILKEQGLRNWTIVRPYITFSETRLQLGVLEKEDWLFRALKGKTIVFPKDIADKFTTLTFGLDVATILSEVVGNKETLGRDYNITSNESILWRDVLNLYLDILENHLSYRPKVLFQELPSFYKHHTARYQVIYDRLYNRRFDNKNVLDLSKNNQFTEVKEGLEDSLRLFLKRPEFGYINWKKEGIRDKATGEFTSFMEIRRLKDILIYLKYRII